MKIKCDRCPEPSVTVTQLSGGTRPELIILCADCRARTDNSFVMSEKPVNAYLQSIRA